MVKRFLFIILIPFAVHSATPQHKAFLDASKNSRVELSASREFHTILQGLRRNRLNSSSTQSLLRLSKDSTAFKEYLPLIQASHEIAKGQGNFTKFFEYCDKPFNESVKDRFVTIGQRFYGDLERFCRGLFLSHLNKDRRKRTTLNPDEMRFLERSLVHYAGGEHLNEFQVFLSRVEKQTELHHVLSQLVASTAIDSKIIPPQEVLNHLLITDKLTEHIQQNGLHDQAAADFFRTEFRRMSNEITTYIRTEKFAEAENILDYSKIFYQQNKKYISQQLAWNTYGLSGRRLLYQKQFKLAQKSFGHAVDISDESQIDESYFFFIFVDILQNDYSSALKTIEKLNLFDNFERHSSKLKYWIARVLEKNGKKKSAHEYYELITHKDPLSFYSILAIKELSKSQPAQTLLKVISKMRAPSSFPDFADLKASEFFLSSLQRLSLWLDLNIDSYSYYEINEILASPPDVLFANASANIDPLEFEKFMVSQLSTFFNDKGKYLHTFRLVHNALSKEHFSLNSEIIQSLYPMEYLDNIKKISPNVDPLVIMSLIRQESAFNESARSVAGARGLMQLMPATARQLQRNVRVNQLNEPSLNIRLGTRYYSRLLNNYDGDLIDTLSAYNAGQGNLRNWKESVFVFGEDDPLKKIEMIPFKETRKYVKLIYRNMFYYRLLTNDPMIAESLAETLKIDLN